MATSASIPLTERQSRRLADLTGLDSAQLKGATLAEIADRHRFDLDQALLFPRRVCGRVVKRNPVTGELEPVPFATVLIEDTDINLLGFFPRDWRFGWYFPFNVRREVIGETTTDRCGRFCVNLPLFDIDWILRWRKTRVCSPDVFVRPSIRDLLEDLVEIPRTWPIKRPWPIPEPDPPPLDLLRDGGLTLRRTEELLGRDVTDRLLRLETAEQLRSRSTARGDVFNADAYSAAVPLPAPVPPQAMDLFAERNFEKLASLLDVNPRFIAEIDLRRPIGPFRRCWNVFVPEWSPILDIPDITFRVTQDVDGDGDQETIYAEGLFDVRWNTGFIPDVTLEAFPNAVSTNACGEPGDVRCADTAEIQYAGQMPLQDQGTGQYHDPASGYALRVNRPKPAGPRPPAETPFYGTLDLFGCNQLDGAEFYRLQYSFEGGAWSVLTAPPWAVWPVGGGPVQLVQPDAQGWYPVLRPVADWFPRGDLLLKWPTGASGTYRLKLELADAARNLLPGVLSPETTLRVDNTLPGAVFNSLEWFEGGATLPDPSTAPWTSVSLVCPTIRRHAGNHVYFRVGFGVNASHLRSFHVNGGGCGGGGMTLLSTNIGTISGNAVAYWHTHVADNTHIGSVIFQLPPSSLEGAYSFALHAIGRPFTPSDPDGPFDDWFIDQGNRQTWATLPVAVVNA